MRQSLVPVVVRSRSSLLAAIYLAAACLFAVSMAQTSPGNRPAPKATNAVEATAPQQDKRVFRYGRFYEPEPIDFGDHSGYQEIFNGKTLNGWDGDPAVWRAEDGAIVGESTKEKPVGNSYIVFRGLEVLDFDLKLEIKVENGGGSGIQYRSKTGLPWIRPLRPALDAPKLEWMMTGPQADFWYPVNSRAAEYSGQFYSENTVLGIIAWRGQVVETSPGSSPKQVANIADRNALGGFVRVNEWNQYLIMARGGTFLHILNGRLMAALVDDDPSSSNNQSGLIGIEIEGTPSKVSVRNIWIKKLR